MNFQKKFTIDGELCLQNSKKISPGRILIKNQSKQIIKSDFIKSIYISTIVPVSRIFSSLHRIQVF